MKTKKISIVVCLMLVITAFAIVPLNVSAADEGEIEASIVAGLEYLAAEQNGDGSWNTYEQVASTAFVLIKLQDRAIELGLDPFEEDPGEPDYYLYASHVNLGWEYIFNGANWFYQPITVQTHGDPDTNGNGHGLWFDTPVNAGHHSTYTSGLVLMALAASQDSGKLGPDYDGDTNPDTFGEIAQDIVDWFAWRQVDSGAHRGGWSYGDAEIDYADNSNSGYAVLGLAAAKDFGCDIPVFVIDELNIWIDYIQNDVSGGSGYSNPNDGWENLLKTGNLIFQMTFYGDNPSTPRFQDAMDYIETFWHHMSPDPGWGYLSTPHYQAMYCLMKGLVYSGIELLDLNGDTIPEHDWFAELAEVIVDNQSADGSWPADYWGNSILTTCWALLTLEKITPTQYTVEIEKHYTHTDVNFNPWHWEYETLFYEDFSGPAGSWIRHDPSEWDKNTGSEMVTTGDSGLPELRLWWDNVDGLTAWIESIPFDTSSADSLTLEFDHMIDVYEFASIGDMVFQVAAKSESIGWTIIDEWHPGFVDMPSATENYDISNFIGTNTQIAFIFSGDADEDLTGWYIDDVEIIAGYIVMDPAELGTPLDSIHMVIHEKNGKVKSHNPGQFYAVIEITGPVQTFRFRDDFDEEFDVHPKKIGTGGCQVILLDPDGYAEVITSSPWVDIKKIDNTGNFVRIEFDFPGELPPGYTLMIYIKFQTVYKNKQYGGDDEFWDNAKYWDYITEKWTLTTGRVYLPITGID